MDEKSSFAGGGIAALYKTFFLDLPLVGLRDAVQTEANRETMKALWKRYDEGVHLATQAIDRLYQDPQFGDWLDRSLQTLLQWQYLSTMMTGAFFPRLSPSVDALSTTEVQALLKELRHVDVTKPYMSPDTTRRHHGHETSPAVEPSQAVATTKSRAQEESTMEPFQDFSEYFEPVDTTPSHPPVNPQSTRHANVFGEMHAYFEPVADSSFPSQHPDAPHPASGTKWQSKTATVRQFQRRRKSDFRSPSANSHAEDAHVTSTHSPIIPRRA
jgi:hypothetical protein